MESLPTIERTEYGRNEHGKPEYRNSVWARVDKWIGNNGEVAYERRACAGPRDKSPMVRLNYGPDAGNARYNADCPCCWLHHSHTLDYHNKAIGAAALSRASTLNYPAATIERGTERLIADIQNGGAR